VSVSELLLHLNCRDAALDALLRRKRAAAFCLLPPVPPPPPPLPFAGAVTAEFILWPDSKPDAAASLVFCSRACTNDIDAPTPSSALVKLPFQCGNNTEAGMSLWALLSMI
jgi:hypothetical protein